MTIALTIAVLILTVAVVVLARRGLNDSTEQWEAMSAQGRLVSDAFAAIHERLDDDARMEERISHRIQTFYESELVARMHAADNAKQALAKAYADDPERMHNR